MSRREEILQRAAEAEKNLRPKEKSYNPGNMDCDKMPFGCWIVIGVVLFLVITIFKNFWGL